MCKVCKHSHFSPWAGTLCGAVRWVLRGIHVVPEYCECRGKVAVWS